MNTFETTHGYGEVIVINVDIQNDFALPTGALAVKDGEGVVEPANAINAYVRELGGLIAFTQDWHRPDNTKHFALWGPHCIQHKAGAALHNDLLVLPGDTIAQKGTGVEDDGYSGWAAQLTSGSMTAMVEGLPAKDRTLGNAIGEVATYGELRGERTAVVLTGIAIEYCLRAAALDGLKDTKRDYVDIIIATDAARAVDSSDGNKAMREMVAAGALAMTSQQIIAGAIARIRKA